MNAHALLVAAALAITALAAAPAAADTLVEGAVATALSQANADGVHGSPMRAVDGSGWDQATGAHQSGSWLHSWVSADKGRARNLNEWFRVDLGGAHELSRVRVYNGNEGQFDLARSRRVVQADLYISTEVNPGPVPMNNASGNGWILIEANVRFDRAPGRSNYGAEGQAIPTELDLQGRTARHVALNIDEQGGEDRFGAYHVQIAEFQVFAQPRPVAATALDGALAQR